MMESTCAAKQSKHAAIRLQLEILREGQVQSPESVEHTIMHLVSPSASLDSRPAVVGEAPDLLLCSFQSGHSPVAKA